MTTSSKESNVSNFNEKIGEHWDELADTISTVTKAKFSDWLDKELEDFEKSLERFVTQNSLRKSLRR